MPSHRPPRVASAPPGRARGESRAGAPRPEAAGRAAEAPGSAAVDGSLLERLVAGALLGLVVLLPFGLAVWRATAAAQWRGDVAHVRDLGLTAVGPGGALSTVLSQALGLLPLGNQAFRAAVGAALALAAASYLLYDIAQRLLAATQGARPLGAPLRTLLAAVATLAATLSPTWQQEASVGGGASIAAVPALGCVALALALTAAQTPILAPASETRWLLVAVVAGLAVGESVPAGVDALVAVLVGVLLSGKPPARRLWPAMAVGFALVVGALWAPLFLRPHAPSSLSDVGRALSATSLAPLRVAASRMSAVEAWIGELGVVSLALAALGVTAGCWRRASRRALGPLVALVAVDLAYPLAAASGLGADRLVALRLLAVAALGVASACGVAWVVGWLLAHRVPMARPASVLGVVFYLSAVAVTCEEAGFAADRSQDFAAEAWTDDALGGLPPRAAVVVHSPELAWRLWAARTSRGERPDVLVVPAPLLHQTGWMASLLPAEPGIAPLLRDFALSGRASEFALSELADERPLYVELFPEWDDRLMGHLAVRGPWLRYAPESLGASDREPHGQEMWNDGSPLGRALAAGGSRDDLTAHVVVRTLKQQAATLSLLGQSAEARSQLERVEQLQPADPFVTGARLRLAYAEQHRQRRVELRDLLRF